MAQILLGIEPCLFLHACAPDVALLPLLALLCARHLQTIHAIKRDGTIMKGTEALKQLYSAVGMGWAAQFGDLPIISTVSGWHHICQLLSVFLPLPSFPLLNC